MENEIWTANGQQSVPTGLERTQHHLNNGNTEKDREDSDSKYAGKDFQETLIKTEPSLEPCPAVTISEKAKETIELILEQIKSLSQVEKFLLFLKLPAEVTNAVDPFRQPLNPLGNRSEIYKTISWIKTHLEEDPDISLPKQEVYNDYYNYCETNNIKPLSQADFGKVMKQVYPRVRARRLGTRGNSRYCYSGLRRCIKLNPPLLPDLAEKPMSTDALFTQSSINTAAWLIIKDWSEKQLGHPFMSIQSLAYHLILNHSIGTGSEAACKIASAAESSIKGENNNKVGNRHREMQIQLQKKLQQKNEGKDKKRKLQSPKSEQKPGGKKCRSQSLPASAAATATSPTAQLPTINGCTVGSECSTSSSSTSTSPTQGKTVCDKSIEFIQLPALPDFKSFQKPADGLLLGSSGQETSLGAAPPISKVPIPRLHSTPQPAAGPQVATKRPVSSKSAKYKSIQPALQRHCDIAPTYNPQPQAVEENRSQDFNNEVGNRIKIKSDEDNGDCDEDVVLTRERLNSVSNVEKDAMDEYLGTNNSQHEEELSKYFNNNISDQENTSKLSTLRKLLEQNGIAETKFSVQNVPDSKVMPDNLTFSNPSLNQTPVQNEMTYITPSIEQGNISNLPLNIKRRVSFELPIAEEPVPPSPNTRRKNFSFTPISPGPQSPNNGVQSKCSSTTASPFVSPRNTPVLRTKSTHQSTGVLKSELRKPIKIKKEDLTIDIPQEGQFSAPSTSPMLKKLLNSNSKVSYHPGYNVHSIPSTPEASQEVQFFSSNMQHNPDTYRSQSAPVHDLLTVKPFPVENNIFISEPETSINDFSEMDPIPDSETDKVKQILNSLDDPACDNNNIDIFNIDITTNNPCLNEFGLQLINSIDINQLSQTNLSFNPPRPMRSQSMDVTTTYENKCNPSRSVPSTPVPFTHNVKIPSKVNYNSSRSYPSTPLNSEETFSYSINGDCLLNGQPIRSDNLTENLDYLPNFEVNGENIDQLQHDKNFAVAGQEFAMIENESALIENCVLLEPNYGGKIN